MLERTMVVTATNITIGGSIFLREPNDEFRVGKESLKGVGTDIAGVDIIYDLEREDVCSPRG